MRVRVHTLGAAVATLALLAACSKPKLLSVGPRLVSNQTSQPLAVIGERLRPGLQLRIGSSAPLPLAIVDERHAYARLPAGFAIPQTEPTMAVSASLAGGEGQAPLTIVNDAAFPDLTSLAVSADGRVYAASATTDELFELQPDTGAVKKRPTFDGPSALAWWGGTLVVSHRFDPRLMLVKPDGTLGAVTALANAEAILVGTSGIAYLAEQARDTVVAMDLLSGTRLWRVDVAPNPKALALVGDRLAVGSLQTGEVQLLDRSTGALGPRIVPGPGTPIIGGGTEKFSEYVMGGKAVRALAFADGRLFSANLGPNIGPNPQRMEVSANGGVSELDPAQGKLVRHRGFGAGVTSALAIDPRAGLLYAADPGLGLVRVLDAKTLQLKQELAVPPPAWFPLVRPATDFGVSHRAGVEVHSGPSALALDAVRNRLFVLNRFTGTVAQVDVAQASAGKASLVKQFQLTEVLAQRERRQGQVLYFSDLGRTSMSCDACHLEGHTEGIFFEKTHPMRIYRSSSIRGAVDTPPYFTPASTRSLAETASKVGGRNRYHNPDPTPGEISAIAQYSAAIAPLPNPFVGADGAPVDSDLELFDHQRGRAREGLRLFEAKCLECHPPPQFTTDQDPATRGRYLDVGTPETLPLRVQMQDLVGKGMAPPSLVGAWDIFPMLSSGSAGLQVEGGDRIDVGARFALRAVVETYGGPRHGGSSGLSVQERNDLLAYLLSL